MNEKSRDEALAHFGVKGMRWGVRNEDELSLGKSKANINKTSDVTKKEYDELIKNQPKKTKAEIAKSIAKNEANFKAKFEPNDLNTEVNKKGWRPTKKQLEIVGIGAAFVGIAAASYYVNNKSLSKTTNLSALAGKHCSVEEYQKLMSGSITRCLGEKWSFTDYSWQRPELSFPEGHVFHRISMSAEQVLGNKGTYCVTSKEELARYIGTTSYGVVGNHHITWTADTEIRVPKLSTVLKTAKEALSETSGKRVSSRKAFQWYLLNSGGSWKFDDPEISKFFEKLAAKGYHAIIDETDAGIYSENPLVFFDRHNPLTQSIPLTQNDILEAESMLTEILHRK